MTTRRNILAASAASVTGWIGLTSPSPATTAFGQESKPAPSPEAWTHVRWNKAHHGFYMIAEGILVPGILEGFGTEGMPEGEKRVFRPWLNVVFPLAALDRREYWLQGFGGTDGKDDFEIAEPVVPPVYTLDDQPLELSGGRGTRLGYADVLGNLFFPWQQVQVKLGRLPFGSRAKLQNLYDAQKSNGNNDPRFDSVEIWTPPDRAAFLKSLWTPPTGEEPKTRGVSLFLARTGMNVSYSFGDEVLVARK